MVQEARSSREASSCQEASSAQIVSSPQNASSSQKATSAREETSGEEFPTQECQAQESSRQESSTQENSSKKLQVFRDIDFIRQQLRHHGEIDNNFKGGFNQVLKRFEEFLEKNHGPYQPLLDDFYPIDSRNTLQNFQANNGKFLAEVDRFDEVICPDDVGARSLFSTIGRDALLESERMTKIDLEFRRMVRKVDEKRKLELVKKRDDRLLKDFSNIAGKLELNAYGNVNVNKRKVDEAMDMTDDEKKKLIKRVYDYVSQSPVTIVPVVLSNPSFFSDALRDMESTAHDREKQLKFARTYIEDQCMSHASATASSATENNTTSVGSTIVPSYACSECEFPFSSRQEMIDHFTTTHVEDEFSFSTQSLQANTFKGIDIIKCFLQGVESVCPPFEKWPRNKSKNRQIHSHFSKVMKKYREMGHTVFSADCANMTFKEILKLG